MRTLVLLAALAGTAHAAKVTAITPTTVYIDAGTADGLRAGATWQATIGGHAASVKVIAAASHDAVLEVSGATLAVGAVIDVPAAAAPPPAPVTPKPPPLVMPPWRPQPQAQREVQLAAQHEQPGVAPEAEHLRVSGELALTAFLAGDTDKSGSTSYQDIGLSSELSITDGPWRYDHLLEAHLAATPELFNAPLQHAQARFDVYLMRLAYTDGRYAASLGRQPAAPLGEFGVLDGARATFKVTNNADVTGFAGLRPSTNLGLEIVPHAGADVGYQTETVGGTHARVDAGVAIDEYKGALDRAAAAASASVSTKTVVVHGDTVVDLASDAAGKGARVTRAAGFIRDKRGRLTLGASAGYDRVFIDRVYAAELPSSLIFGPRTFGEADATYAYRHDLDLGTSASVSRGDGFTSGYYDVSATWYRPSLRLTLAPHAILGSLVDELGVRASLGRPVWRGNLELGGSVDRVWATGEAAIAGLGRAGYSFSFWQRWRTAVSAEVAAGDGPVRVFLFALLGYRL